MPGAALLLLAGCGANPPYATPVVYAPAPAWPRTWPPPPVDDAPVYVDPPRYVPRPPLQSMFRAVERAAARIPDPVAIDAPEPEAPDNGPCHGYWRICAVLPGWRYEN